MKLMKNKLIWLFLVIGTIYGCKKDEGGISVTLQNEVNEFIWFAMNDYYFWQAEVEDLTVEKYPTFNALYTFLNTYSQPESLFNALLYKDDRFSWIVDDYEELEQSFQGVSKSYGLRLGLLRLGGGGDDLMAYVRYVVPGGPADNAGLVRGDVFTEVNGQSLTLSNYISLLFESESATITLATIQDNVISSTNTEVSITAVELTENPILVSKVLDVGSSKVGYLMYNQFINNNAYHEEMNNAFGEFKNQGISDLVLDLRYNGGGSVTTSRILTSMIYGSASANTIMGSIIYNSKLSRFNTNLPFLTEVPVFNNEGTQISTTAMNRLDINRIFVLIGGSSASASEFVIAGLLPYMDVTLIGTTTVGKNVGSITLYDSDDNQKSATLNPNHKYAIQPIISQLANSQGFTDYINGLEPNIPVNEVDFLGTGLKPLGDPEEALLAEALAVISGAARVAKPPHSGREAIPDPSINEPTSTILIDHPEVPELIRERLFPGDQ